MTKPRIKVVFSDRLFPGQPDRFTFEWFDHVILVNERMLGIRVDATGKEHSTRLSEMFLASTGKKKPRVWCHEVIVSDDGDTAYFRGFGMTTEVVEVTE